MTKEEVNKEISLRDYFLAEAMKTMLRVQMEKSCSISFWSKIKMFFGYSYNINISFIINQKGIALSAEIMADEMMKKTKNQKSIALFSEIMEDEMMKKIKVINN